jgi:hypothetical protein
VAAAIPNATGIITRFQLMLLLSFCSSVIRSSVIEKDYGQK